MAHSGLFTYPCRIVADRQVPVAERVPPGAYPVGAYPPARIRPGATDLGGGDGGQMRPAQWTGSWALPVHARNRRHPPVRYALFYAQTDGAEVKLTHFYLTTGAAFFTRFPQFGGKVLNKKLQIPLPSDFFNR